MATVRFFLAMTLIALGCALLICANEPRPATACWVGSGVHDASVFFLPGSETATHRNAP